MTEPPVAAWEINEVAFCALKLALTQIHGDKRTPERERGRRFHQGVDTAIEESPIPRIQDFEDAKRQHGLGAPLVFSKLSLLSDELGLQAQTDLVFWTEELELFELKTLQPGKSPPRERFRLLDTASYESDAAQAIFYGLLLEQKFQVMPRLWVVYGREEFVERMRAAASAPTANVLAMLRTLRDSDPREVPFTPGARRYIQRLIYNVRRVKLRPDEIRRSHDLERRCLGCAYRPECSDPHPSVAA